MNFFKKSIKKEPICIKPPAQSRVEIELHKDASVQASEKAKATNKHLKELLNHNGFTLKIYLAAGGHGLNKTKGKGNI